MACKAQIDFIFRTELDTFVTFSKKRANISGKTKKAIKEFFHEIKLTILMKFVGFEILKHFISVTKLKAVRKLIESFDGKFNHLWLTCAAMHRN